MERWKATAKKLFFLPVWQIILLVIFSAVMLVLVFVKGWTETPVAYAVYVIAFYTVTVATVFLTLELPKKCRSIRQRIYENPLGNRYMTDTAFKVKLSLWVSLTINLAYSAVNLISGILLSSIWTIGIAVYYILLSVIRFVLLFHLDRKHNAGLAAEYRSSRKTAIGMLLVNLTLSGIVLNMILEEQPPAASDVLVITSATYTFYILTLSIADIIRYRKYNSPVLSAAKTIRFTQALVSLLPLEASMLAQFGDDTTDRRMMIAMTGAGVCIIVLAMSIYMIAQANKEIRKMEEHYD